MNPPFVLLIDKPGGITSHDVVDRVRALTGIRKVGHTGTLDPFATGLLIVLVGREATREQQRFLQLPKTYSATLRLGATSDTGDPEGRIEKREMQGIERKIIEKTLVEFVGPYSQRPPRFSAKKIGGKKAYELARKGKSVSLEPKEVTIYNIHLLSYTWPLAKIKTTVSSGTYIRSLTRDIGEKVQAGAYLTALRRTHIGPFNVADACSLQDCSNENAIALKTALQALDREKSS